MILAMRTIIQMFNRVLMLRPALLVNRTDYGYDSELNFDALLLEGYFCHACSPYLDLTCDVGGICTNVQWLGYTCDNDFRVSMTKKFNLEIAAADDIASDPNSIVLKEDVAHRFIASENTIGFGTVHFYFSKTVFHVDYSKYHPQKRTL